MPRRCCVWNAVLSLLLLLLLPLIAALIGSDDVGLVPCVSALSTTTTTMAQGNRRRIAPTPSLQPSSKIHGIERNPWSLSSLVPSTVRPSRTALRNHPNSEHDEIVVASSSSSSSSSSNLEANEDDDANNNSVFALAVLFTVPLAWGTFEPAVRLVYALDPPVPGFLFGTAYYGVAASALLLVSVVERPITQILSQQRRSGKEEEPEKQNSITSDDAAFDWNSLQGGLELGTYLFVGNALQVLGLQTIASDRAAFLLQLTTIFVPVADAIIHRVRIPARTWAAGALALLGVAILSQENSGGTANTDGSMLLLFDLQRGSSLGIGDCYVIAAAVCYTFHCLRLETYAQRVPSAFRFAAGKAVTELSWSLVAVYYFVSQAAIAEGGGEGGGFAQDQGTSILAFMDSISSRVEELHGAFWTDPTISTALLATLWTGLVAVAYTIAAQSYGQRYVRPITANIIYTLQPVATALVAWILLNERLEPVGYVGAGLLCAAVALVVVDGDGPEKSAKEGN